ncbi:hypothetical protein Glove_9g177 [Diversispora epigaea]|uniref:Uncharacterized protein n=1 Tax=Diversispora epigaea TaxID=1348612 RepID=A0A397JNI5_9GLOM|nr:hypothetical protein Glove_9g177 [Diversispora epigaea]
MNGIEIFDTSSQNFTEFLNDKVSIISLENVKAIIIFGLMLAANEFELEELSKKLFLSKIKPLVSLLNHYGRRDCSLSTNFEEWNKENFLTSSITIQQCLPYIRYFHIHDDDIWDKIKLYKKIPDKQLFKDLIQQFISSDRPTVKSIILPAREKELSLTFTTIIS